MIEPIPGLASEVPIMGTFDRFGLWEVPGMGGLHSGKLVCGKNNKVLYAMAPADLMDGLEKGLDPALETVAVIRGVIETGEHVLLDRCANVGRRLTSYYSEPRADREGSEMPGGTSSIAAKTYMARSMYVSRAPVPRRPASTRASVSYTGLFTWLNHRSIVAKAAEDSTTITPAPPKAAQGGSARRLLPDIKLRVCGFERHSKKRVRPAAVRCGHIRVAVPRRDRLVSSPHNDVRELPDDGDKAPRKA